MVGGAAEEERLPLVVNAVEVESENPVTVGPTERVLLETGKGTELVVVVRKDVEAKLVVVDVGIELVVVDVEFDPDNYKTWAWIRRNGVLVVDNIGSGIRKYHFSALYGLAAIINVARKHVRELVHRSLSSIRRTSISL